MLERNQIIFIRNTEQNSMLMKNFLTKSINEPRQNFLNTIHCGAKFWAIFVFRPPNPKIQNEIVFSDPDSKIEMISDSSYDQ